MYTIIKNEPGYEAGQASVSTRDDSIQLDHGFFGGNHGGQRARYSVREAKQIIKALGEAIAEIERNKPSLKKTLSAAPVGTVVRNTHLNTNVVKVAPGHWYSENRNEVQAQKDFINSIKNFAYNTTYVLDGKPLKETD